jgi:hypothetical protein
MRDTRREGEPKPVARYFEESFVNSSQRPISPWVDNDLSSHLRHFASH